VSKIHTSLRAAIHLDNDAYVPGITPMDEEIAAMISNHAMVFDEEWQTWSYTNAMSELAKVMPATSSLGLLLQDPLHSELLEKDNFVTLMAGINFPFLIMSAAGTSTPIHREDLLMAASNTNFVGHHKEWVIAYLADEEMVSDFFEARGQTARVYTKEVFTSLSETGARYASVMQYSGATVLTLFGEVWHQTASGGTGIAEANNSWWGYSEDKLGKVGRAFKNRGREEGLAKDRGINEESIKNMYFDEELWKA
jgi:hypothetical protein